MCGIFGYVGSRSDAADIVLSGLKSLEYRGYDSWGIAYGMSNTGNGKDETRLIMRKQVGKIGTASLPSSLLSSIALGHTRWATHGGVTRNNAHPHMDCTGHVALVHNGIITNWETLKNQCIHSHVFHSETDTEVVPHVIEELLTEYPFAEAVRRAYGKLTGMNAIVAIHGAEHTIVAAKNGSPLIIGFGKDGSYIASDQSALSPFVQSIHVLRDGEMAILSDSSIRIQSARTGNRIRPRHTEPPKAIEEQANRNGSTMRAEIGQQPEILAQIAGNAAAIRPIADAILPSDTVILTGCGTAYHAALAGTYLFSALAGRRTVAAIASECPDLFGTIGRDTDLIAFSQSGETMDTLTAVSWAKVSHARVFGFVNVPHSAIWDASDISLHLGAGTERAVASTKAFTAKLAYCTHLACALSETVDSALLVKKAAMATGIVCSPAIQRIIRKTARRIFRVDHLFVIGKGPLYPIALETALKIKEISYIHAEGMASTELKHGPLALISKGTPCIVLSNGKDDDRTRVAASELKARGAYIIGIGPVREPVYDTFIPIANAGILTMIPIAVAGQCLAYELTVLKGLDPDKPRNLAKSVTVG